MSIRRFTTAARAETWGEVLSKNQRVFNQKFPTTPLTSGQKTFVKVANATVNAGYVTCGVVLGLVMSTGVWAPYYINRQRTKIEQKYAELKGEIN